MKNKDQITFNERFDQLQARKGLMAADETTQGDEVDQAR
jgi:hypothetical protein